MPDLCTAMLQAFARDARNTERIDAILADFRRPVIHWPSCSAVIDLTDHDLSQVAAGVIGKIFALRGATTLKNPFTPRCDMKEGRRRLADDLLLHRNSPPASGVSRPAGSCRIGEQT